MRKHVLVLIGLLVLGFTSFDTTYATNSGSPESDATINPLYDESVGEIQLQDSTPNDPVSDTPITWANLINGDPAEGLIANRHFAPPRDALAPSTPFEGTLNLQNATMGTSPLFHFGKGRLHGKDTTRFPDVSIDFFTVDTHLVPTTQDVIPNGTLAETSSYWDMIVQPGRVWQSPDNADRGWNRASFPFALVNRLEGETHTGIALFVYNAQEVSHVRFQIVSQTRPGEVPDYFNAWGVTAASYSPGRIDHVEDHTSKYLRQVASRFPTAPLSELEALIGAETLAAFDGASNDKEKASILQTALMYDGVLYTSPCHTPAGPFPYCSETRYGVWSVTKSAILNVSMLRLAQKYGAGLLEENIADYIPVPANLTDWEDVTFLDMANMASGRGGTAENPTCYLCDYQRWNLAPSQGEKIAEALDYLLVWEPGTRYVYRDQDAFLLGAALEMFLQSKEGEDATLDRMLLEEVFEPIGIFYAPANFTIEAGGADGQIKAEFGYYPTIDDLTKIALLYQNRGVWGGNQILHPELVDSLLPKQDPPEMALVKEGEDNAFGPTYYAMNWHIEPYRTADDCTLYLPTMYGWGGNLVTLLPDDIVAIRIANSVSDLENAVPQARVAEQLTTLCTN